MPYADHVLSPPLVDLDHDGASLAHPRALVYSWGMRNNLCSLAGPACGPEAT